MSQLNTNTATLQELLDIANALPEAGVVLPELTNPGTASNLLSSKQLIDTEGNIVEGTMINNGAVTKTLNTSTTSYTIPAGYHNGSGKVSITTETKTVTPKTSAQSITPTSGKVLSKVTVNGDANLIAENIKSGISIFGVNGSLSSGAQFATGTFTPSSTSIATANTTICTINNLSFTPKQVIIQNAAKMDMSSVSATNGYKYVIGLSTGEVNKKLYGAYGHNNSYPISSTPTDGDNGGLTIIENGFTWITNETFDSLAIAGLKLASSYSYLAIA